MAGTSIGPVREAHRARFTRQSQFTITLFTSLLSLFSVSSFYFSPRRHATHRHRLKAVPTPNEFKQYVQKRLIKGRWHLHAIR